MEPLVNLAIQFLPLEKPQPEAYRIIDLAIAAVQQSGLRYEVCPFETVVEGPYTEVMALLNRMQDAAFDAGAGTLLINMKLHRSRTASQRIEDKTGAYAASPRPLAE